MGTVPEEARQYHYPFNGYCKQIDNLTKDEVSDDYIGNRKDISKHHWKSTDGLKWCMNKTCNKPFSSLLERPHHCRRCGGAFCTGCVMYKRRLNKLAHFDPDGDLYKVCQLCFEEGGSCEGQRKSHTTHFLAMRQALKNNREVRANGETSLSWRANLDLEQECTRLLQGFSKSIEGSEIKKTLHGLKSFISTPVWMKSSVWNLEKVSPSCQMCMQVFGLTRTKVFCNVCGKAVCKTCSSLDLLMFVPDTDKGKQLKPSPKLAIIKIIGCPEVEPEVHIYLRVCSVCRKWLVMQQVNSCEEDGEGEGQGFLDQLSRVHLTFVKAEARVKDQLPKYRDVVASLDDRTSKTNSQSNTKVLAKAQEDLSDALAHHVALTQQLKRLRPQTDKQASLLKKFITAKCEFYLDHQAQFRGLKHKLCESVPPESLDFIQRIMDKNAIISTHLYVRQLVYESLHLCDKYKLDNSLPVFLMTVEQKVEIDVKDCLLKNKEDTEEHFTVMTSMIKIRMKENKLIKPSQTQLKKRGHLHVYEVINTRSEAILNQVNFQLQLASAHRSFSTSKRALERALSELPGLKQTQIRGGHDFVVV